MNNANISVLDSTWWFSLSEKGLQVGKGIPKQNKTRKMENTMKNRKQGFTLVEIMIVVMIIGLLAAIALPGFARARATSQKNACINNMRQIESAKDQYAVEAGLATGDGTATAAQLGAFIKGAWPTCPVGQAVYNLGTVGETAVSCPNGGEHVLPN